MKVIVLFKTFCTEIQREKFEILKSFYEPRTCRYNLSRTESYIKFVHIVACMTSASPQQGLKFDIGIHKKILWKSFSRNVRIAVCQTDIQTTSIVHIQSIMIECF